MLNRFKEYLLQKGDIQLHHVSYYIKWVGDCYAFLDAPASTFLNSDRERQFLAYMAKKPRRVPPPVVKTEKQASLRWIGPASLSFMPSPK